MTTENRLKQRFPCNCFYSCSKLSAIFCSFSRASTVSWSRFPENPVLFVPNSFNRPIFSFSRFHLAPKYHAERKSLCYSLSPKPPFESRVGSLRRLYSCRCLNRFSGLENASCNTTLNEKKNSMQHSFYWIFLGAVRLQPTFKNVTWHG